MIGATPTLKDIVLTELPEPVDLHCDEQINEEDDRQSEEEEEEEEEEDYEVTHQSLYQIVSVCDTCHADIRLLVNCTETDIQILEHLLSGTLALVCPRCARMVRLCV
ncbi:early protein E7 [Alouatta guariba papillomavirus 1]|uniref:Protein E7 n=1 Tax=Alouatta guariba papillomavirus 1 TaxID=1784959 RepID=A0A140CBZ7_9PAPI|nr:early protein E7 [Alouatta guariba papillomavirus 1]AMB19786.1 early protein E7 [Alouatta guariba papillomavirus 1]